MLNPQIFLHPRIMERLDGIPEERWFRTLMTIIRYSIHSSVNHRYQLIDFSIFGIPVCCVHVRMHNNGYLEMRSLRFLEVVTTGTSGLST